MATLATTVATTPSRAGDGSVDVTAQRMYDAEVALHIARQAGVDAWVAAAYDRLHEAIAMYTAAHAVRSGAGGNVVGAVALAVPAWAGTLKS